MAAESAYSASMDDHRGRKVTRLREADDRRESLELRQQLRDLREDHEMLLTAFINARQRVFELEGDMRSLRHEFEHWRAEREFARQPDALERKHAQNRRL